VLAANPGTAAGADPAEIQNERSRLDTQLAAREAEEQQVSAELAAADDLTTADAEIGMLSWLVWGPKVAATAMQDLCRNVRGSARLVLGCVVLAAAVAAAWFAWGSRIGVITAAAERARQESRSCGACTAGNARA
jgi:hypothetical protein